MVGSLQKGWEQVEMDEKSQALCGCTSSSGGKHSDCAFSQAYQDSVKHHIAKSSPGSALDTHRPAEPGSNLILDTESASASYLQSDVCLACRAELTSKAEFTLDDTQEKQG